MRIQTLPEFTICISGKAASAYFEVTVEQTHGLLDSTRK